MSKMGISTYQSYCGAQIFDAIGLKSDFVDKYFTGTATMIEGVGLEEIADGDGPPPRATPSATIRCCATRSKSAANMLFRMRGEAHIWSPDAVATLQHAVRKGSWETFKEFSEQIDSETARAQTIRGLFRIKMAEETGRKPVAARRGRCRRPTSSSASRPARCRSARSRARRIRRWRAP